MASATAIAIECDKQLKRIEAALGLDDQSIRRTHKDTGQLRLIQLRAIADAFELELDDRWERDNQLKEAKKLVDSGSWTKTEMESVLLGFKGSDS